MYFPSGDKYSIAVRCCPILFQKTEQHEKEIFDLPYKMVVAVATKSTVLLYDTEHAAPFGYVTDIHYTRLTDMSWFVYKFCFLNLSQGDPSFEKTRAF